MKRSIRDNPSRAGRRASEAPYSSDGLRPIWCFDQLDLSGPFAFRTARADFDHRDFLDKMIAFSSLTWAEIKSQTHDRGKSKHHHLSPESLSPEALERIAAKRMEAETDALFSFALNNRLRVIGIRRNEFFHVVWYDANHAFCPSRRG